MVLDSRMAELLTKISPETYQEYIHQNCGQAYIYCKLNVALKRTLKAALLFWKQMVESLKMWEFHRTGAFPTKWLTDINSPSYGTLMISRVHTSVQRWSGKLLYP